VGRHSHFSYFQLSSEWVNVNIYKKSLSFK
jgi:hypothetical protein